MTTKKFYDDLFSKINIEIDRDIKYATKEYLSKFRSDLELIGNRTLEYFESTCIEKA